MDSNLLKEAIADAKAVRHTAFANAKVALEEAFTERYKAMFAEKLKEEAEMPTAPAEEEEGKMTGAEPVSETEIDELIKELENEVGEEPAGEPGGVPPADGAGEPPAPLAAPIGGAAGAPPMGGAPTVCPPGTIPCPGAPGGQPIPQAGAAPMGAPPVGAPPMGGAPEGMPPVGGPEGAPEPPPSDAPAAGAQEEDEEFDLNELLESLKAEIGDEEEEEEDEEKKLDEQTKLSSSGIGGSKAGGSANKKPSASASSSSKIETAANDDEGYPEIDQAKVTAKVHDGASRPNQAKNATKDNLSTPSMGEGNGTGGQPDGSYPKIEQAKVTAKVHDGATRPNQAKNATKDNLSTPGGMLQEIASLKKQNNEAEEVIRYVKGQLNEVNLLNAKLLYTNKLFKEFTMTNDNKMRIVELFDLAKNVREVKLTYANITESLNFGGKEVKKKVHTSASVQSITEGLASGAVASTKPKEIISEGKFAARMKQLAGIRNEPKK